MSNVVPLIVKSGIVHIGIVCDNIIIPCDKGPYTVVVGMCDHKAAPHDSYGVIVPGCGSIVPPINQHGDPWLAVTVSKRGEVEVQFGVTGAPIQTNGITDASITIDGIRVEVHWDNGRKAYRTRSPELLAALSAKVGQEIQVSLFRDLAPPPPLSKTADTALLTADNTHITADAA